MQELNGGREFPAANDRRHNLNIIIAHRFDKHWTVSASWTFRSGRRGNVATTVVSGGRIDEYDPVGDNFSSEEGLPSHDMVTYDPGNGTSFTATAGFTHIAAATPSASPTSTISTCAWSTLCATAAPRVRSV